MLNETVQSVIVFAIVAVATFYVARMLWTQIRGFSGGKDGKASPCGGCGACGSSKEPLEPTAPKLITLSAPPRRIPNVQAPADRNQTR